jgi:hypothetical protein
MTLEQALSILENVGAKFVGNLADHNAIQQALAEVKKALAQKPVDQE